jgi:broad specificity phosphatase PhoE
MAGMRTALLLLALLPLGAQADEKLWQLLRAGGQVVLMRHTITDPGSGDPPGMRLDDCATQRNLSDEGRAHARRIGEGLKKRGIPAGSVVSSPWCRCVETAKLALGRVDATSSALSNLFGRHENRERQAAEMRKLVVREKANRFLVSHGSTISALTGVYLGTGEMVVVTPAADGSFAVRGKLRLE